MDSLVAFESLTEKEKRRELRRKERDAILSKAEMDFRRREEKKKQAELRGEGSWMLSSVEDRINNEQKEMENVLRKKDKKKAKKDKKSKHKRKHHRSSSASDSEKDSAVWVEKSASAIGNERSFGPKLERDSWMTEEIPFAASLVPSSRQEKIKPRNEILDKAGQHRLELNPFWKGGGTGLPDAAAAVPLSGTGDGGLSWLRKALQRCIETAKEENRTVEEVAAERYGSLKDLKKKIKDAEEMHGEEQRRPRLNFRRPMDEDDAGDKYQRRRDLDRTPDRHSRWRKKTEPNRHSESRESHGKKTESNRHSESRESHRKGDVDEAEVNPEEKTSSSEESDDEKNETAPEEPKTCERVLSEKEINEIGAKLIKAELLGDEALAKQLKEQLECSRKVRDTKLIASKVKSSEANEEVAMLIRTDRQGLARPLPKSQYPVEPLRGRGRKKLTSTHEGVKRTKYFDDDEKYNLKDLVEREKLSTTEDSNMLFARLAGRNVQGDDEDMDDKMVDKAAMKQSVSLMESRERQLAIIEHKKMSSSLEKCHRCFDNVSKHLLVAVGLKVYLALPHHESMIDGHCLIVPITHEVQSTRLDEDVWEEIKIFRKGLTRMFADSGRDCVFMETSINLKRYPHMVIECVPMPKEVGEMAPIYFKKSLDECEGEWADNKKIVDLRNKDVRQAVPKGFPYFAVSFGLQEGYAHIVEDERSFPSYFGREVVGGMLELESSVWRRPQKESFEKQRQKVLKFATEWKDYDWTVKLKSAD